MSHHQQYKASSDLFKSVFPLGSGPIDTSGYGLPAGHHMAQSDDLLESGETCESSSSSSAAATSGYSSDEEEEKPRKSLKGPDSDPNLGKEKYLAIKKQREEYDLNTDRLKKLVAQVQSSIAAQETLRETNERTRQVMDEKITELREAERLAREAERRAAERLEAVREMEKISTARKEEMREAERVATAKIEESREAERVAAVRMEELREAERLAAVRMEEVNRKLEELRAGAEVLAPALEGTEPLTREECRRQLPDNVAQNLVYYAQGMETKATKDEEYTYVDIRQNGTPLFTLRSAKKLQV